MKIKLAVLFGGKSTEHEISVISAIQAISSLDKDKYDVFPIYITKSNEMFIGENIGRIESYTDINVLLKKSQRIILVNENEKTYIVKYPMKVLSKSIVNSIDVVLPIVHGTNVEDGNLQGYLNMLDVPYVGCDVLSSAIGMDKYIMKVVLKANGIPVLDCKRYSEDYYYGDSDVMIEDIKRSFPYPVIVKPINLGSSIGISKVSNDEELIEALDLGFTFTQTVIIETFIQNLKEINCSVIGDHTQAEASECEEPINAEEILSFNGKYISGNKSKNNSSKGMASLQRKIPAQISELNKNRIQELAVRAFMCLGCNGISRIDFLIDTQSDTIWLNEINTIPGSLSFYLWEPGGLKYSALLDKIINLALKRNREQERIIYSFDSNVLSGALLSGQKGAKS